MRNNTIKIIYDFEKKSDKNLEEIVDVFKSTDTHHEDDRIVRYTYSVSNNPAEVIYSIINIMNNMEKLSNKEKSEIRDKVNAIFLEPLKNHLLTLTINEKEMNNERRGYFMEDFQKFYKDNGGENSNELFKIERKTASPLALFEKREYASLSKIITKMVAKAEEDPSSGASKTLTTLFGSLENANMFLESNIGAASPSSPSSPMSPGSPGSPRR